jgi:hypothetical protein
MKAFWTGTGNMNQRIFELAIEELNRQKSAIEAEIEAIRGELRGSGAMRVAKAPAIAEKKRVRSASQRKAQSERMRKYWAAKKLPAAAAKESKKANPKPQKATSKAISDAMRAYWAKKKAAGKNLKPKSKVTPSK